MIPLFRQASVFPLLVILWEGYRFTPFNRSCLTDCETSHDTSIESQAAEMEKSDPLLLSLGWMN
jgi:hypothetical protein